MQNNGEIEGSLSGFNADLYFRSGRGWSARKIKVGRFVFEDVRVDSREGSHDLNDTLRMAHEKTRRVRGAQSRYQDPLPPSAPPRLLSIEAADYLQAMQRRGVAAGTLNAKRHMFRLLKLAAGDIPVSDISARHIREFWEVHRWWPKSAGLHKRFKGLSDADILAEGKRMNSRPPTQSSSKSAGRYLAAFFNHLLRTRVIAHTPIDPFMEVKSDLMGPDARRPFSEEELKVIFDPENFIPWASKYPEHWWGTILGLYTGARVNEIAQLKVADVIEHHGVPCIAIRKTVDPDLSFNSGMRTRQRLKGKSAIRFIPIAAPVLAAGFLDYVADIQATRHPRLFPHLSCGVNKATGLPNGAGYGRRMSLRFSKYLHSVLDLPLGFSFHLFRHTLATSLRDAGVQKELLATITGHEIRKVVPVLEENYLHANPRLLVQEQAAAIALFSPPVELPRYVRGQFARVLRATEKFHP